MNHYEFLGILSGSHADTEVGAIISSIEETIKKHTETIHYVQNLGRRKLAYPVKHQGHGTYVLIEFDAPGDAVKKLDRLFRLTNELLRHCIVRRKTVGKPLPLERKEEDARPRSYERTGMRKTLGEELLGETPTLSTINEPTDTKTTDAQAEEKPVEKTIVLAPVEQQGNASDDSHAAASAPTTDDSAQTPTGDDDSAEENAKKKNKKVSYEELDKKLNELMSDDII
ncbi:30S ribosomal protein S6 [Candidatus Uhrbacteria bacterium]|nr:30S ribosomal protein S6 [Candidatus Uhrbacteria bacterium]